MTKYNSSRGGGKITPAQFVMEQFLLLLAQQEKTTLPDHFWKLEKYQKLWKRHVKSLHARLKEYSPEAITRALKDKRLKNLRSLDIAAKWLWKPVFDKYQKTIKEELKRKNICAVEEIDPTKRRKTTSTSIDILRDLDEN